MKILLTAVVLAAAPMFAAEPAATASTAAAAINEFGVDLLHHAGKPNANFLLSPYSIQSALAMTYAGADGVTRDEMAKALHYPKDEAELHRSFAALQKSLNDIMRLSADHAEREKRIGLATDPITLTVANRLFGQIGFEFRASFLALLKEQYDAPLEMMDFGANAALATKQINQWVEQQTRDRIRDLVPDGALDSQTRLVLVNALYLKAPWEERFVEAATRPLPFRVNGQSAVDVPTMMLERMFGFAKRDGYSALGIPYRGSMRFLIFLPDKVDGLPALEKRLTGGMWTENSRLPSRKVTLYLPKFKLEPALLPLGKELRNLGMKSAFNQPPGSANFDRMVARRTDQLYISEVFHKTFLALDEKGTEAAAATAVAMKATSLSPEEANPIEVKVDRPFLFAIQHGPSGACLFLGHVTDPR